MSAPEHELSAYLRGWVDGAAARVPAPPGVDAEVVELASRISARLTGEVVPRQRGHLRLVPDPED